MPSLAMRLAMNNGAVASRIKFGPDLGAQPLRTKREVFAESPAALEKRLGTLVRLDKDGTVAKDLVDAAKAIKSNTQLTLDDGTTVSLTEVTNAGSQRITEALEAHGLDRVAAEAQGAALTSEVIRKVQALTRQNAEGLREVVGAINDGTTESSRTATVTRNLVASGFDQVTRKIDAQSEIDDAKLVDIREAIEGSTLDLADLKQTLEENTAAHQPPPDAAAIRPQHLDLHSSGQRRTPAGSDLLQYIEDNPGRFEIARTSGRVTIRRVGAASSSSEKAARAAEAKQLALAFDSAGNRTRAAMPDGWPELSAAVSTPRRAPGRASTASAADTPFAAHPPSSVTASPSRASAWFTRTPQR